MPRWTRRLTLLAVLVAALAGFALTHSDASPQADQLSKQDHGESKKDGKETDKGKAPDKAKAPTVKAEKGPFKIEVALKGLFESSAMTEVSLHFDGWNPPQAPLMVLSAVEPGTAVKQGEVLLSLDSERIDQVIHDLESEQRLAEMSLKLLEAEVPALEKSTPLEMAAAERARRIADEDMKRFRSEERAFEEEAIRFQVRSYQQYLEYEKEELKQLEKMYRSRDLTEETEEIILKRARFYVEMYTFYLKEAERMRDRILNIGLPRQEEALKAAVERTAADFDKARTTLPLALSQKQVALEKSRYDRTKATEKLTKLRKDRELFTVKAPCDGVVYYGRCVQGNWSGGSMNKLLRGGIIQPDEVVMTIVQPRPLFIRATVDEKDMAYVTAGGGCKVVPTAAPDARLDGKVEKVGIVPSGGNFEVRVSVGPGLLALMPGMACTVKLVPYAKEEAITLPASVVFEDELNDDKHYVYRAGSSGPEKRPVQIGKRAGGRVEITDGLKAGDEVLMAKP
jgi:multidrug efflux pump subunit AcrA (membrane-fusion protein)